jgi:methylmalonyl-CoA mutase
MVQLAYSLAHANEYFNRIPVINQPIVIQVAVGTNISLKLQNYAHCDCYLFNLVAKEYNHDLECHLSPQRNKTSMIITSTCYDDGMYVGNHRRS